MNLVKPGLLAVDGRGQLHLQGSICGDCHEVSLGATDICGNCGGEEMQATHLSDSGTLWTYTVVRHRPPAGYLGAQPFEPFALGMIELPEGIRVMAPLVANLDEIAIGQTFRFQSWVLHEQDGSDIQAFRYSRVPEDD